MSTTPILGLTHLEIGQAQKEVTINENMDIIDATVYSSATAAIWARVYHNATQSLTTATLTAINFNSERADTNVIHDTATNNTRLTCKTAGTYLIIGQLGYAAHATGVRSTIMRLGGATFIASVAGASAGGADPTRHIVSTIYPLAVNDYVELMGYQASGGALNTEQVGNMSPEFMMIRLGA